MATFKIKTWRTDRDFAGKAAVTKTSPASVYAFDSKGNFILLYKTYTKNATIGMLSGRGVVMTNGIAYYLVTLKNTFKDYVFGYVPINEYIFSAVRALDEAQAKNDAQVLFNNLIASDQNLQLKINSFNELLNKAEKKGIPVTQYREKITKIAEVWKERQNSIATNPMIRITKKISGTDNAIGIIPLIVWGAAIGAGAVLVGLTVYYFLKPEYNTSQLHSKYVSDNEAELKAKLGEEGYAQLKESVDKEIKASAQTAYDEGKGEGTWSIIKPLGLGLLGFVLLNKFQNAPKGKFA